jgi:formate transporter
MLNESPRDVYIPSEMREKAIQSAVAKSKLPLLSLTILSILAGIYIALGAVFSSIIALGMAGTWPYGLMKSLQGLAFSLGLILVVVGGAELFTGNNLMVIAWLDRKIKIGSILKNWGIAYLGNFVGSILIALLVIISKEYSVNDGALGKSIINLAVLKVSYPFLKAFTLGILCNLLVCLAVWLTYSGRSTIDKIMAIVFPISAFIAAGFEHSVANMYIIPAGLLLVKFDPSFIIQSAINTTTLTWSTFFLNNLFPVTLGNIIGGAFFVGFLYFFAYKKQEA